MPISRTRTLSGALAAAVVLATPAVAAAKTTLLAADLGQAKVTLTMPTESVVLGRRAAFIKGDTDSPITELAIGRHLVGVQACDGNQLTDPELTQIGAAAAVNARTPLATKILARREAVGLKTMGFRVTIAGAATASPRIVATSVTRHGEHESIELDYATVPGGSCLVTSAGVNDVADVAAARTVARWKAFTGRSDPALAVLNPAALALASAVRGAVIPPVETYVNTGEGAALGAGNYSIDRATSWGTVTDEESGTELQYGGQLWDQAAPGGCWKSTGASAYADFVHELVGATLPELAPLPADGRFALSWAAPTIQADGTTLLSWTATQPFTGESATGRITVGADGHTLTAATLGLTQFGVGTGAYTFPASVPEPAPAPAC